MRNGARVGGFTYYEISATPLHRLAHYLTPPLHQVGVDRTYLCLTPNCSFLDISTAILPLAFTLADSEPVRVRIKQKMGGRGNSATFRPFATAPVCDDLCSLTTAKIKATVTGANSPAAVPSTAAQRNLLRGRSSRTPRRTTAWR
jgi:hypothetical protein